MTEFKIRGQHIPLLNGLLYELECIMPSQPASHDACLVEVIDVSGSMSGSTINALNECLITNPPDNLKHKRRLRIVFNHEAKIHDTHLMNTSGGTNFTEAFKLLIQVIRNQQLTHGHVLFITDGQDDKNLSNLNKVLDDLKSTIINYSLNLHLIGYGTEHDIGLMENLVKQLPAATFDFAHTAPMLRQFVNVYSDIVNTTPIKCVISDNDREITVDVLPNHTTKFLWQGVSTLPDTLLLKYADICKTVHIGSFDLLSTDNTSTTHIVLEYLDTCIQSLKQSQMSSTRLSQEIQHIRDLLNTVSLQMLQGRHCKNKSSLSSMLEELRKDVNSIAVSAVTTLATTDIVTRATQLASQYGMKQGLQNKLARRILKNNDDTIQQDINTAIQHIPANMSCDIPDDEFVDIWSMETWKDILYDNKIENSDGNVICVCLKVARSAGVAIADPSQLKILDVSFEQYVSWQTFISLYKLELAKDATGINVVGGFDFSKAVETGLLKGFNMMKEFNAVFPLYVSKDNWSVAQYVMKWALGHMTCMDHRGFNESQEKTIPFLILEFMERQKHQNRTELYNKILRQVTLVCRQYMDADVIKETNQWIDDLLADRLTREQCPNLQVMIGRVLCMDETRNRTLLANNVMTLFAEQIRRLARGSKGSRTNEDIIETLVQVFHIPSIDKALIDAAMADRELKVINIIETMSVPDIEFDYETIGQVMQKYVKKMRPIKRQLRNNFGLPSSSNYEIVDIITWGIYHSNQPTSMSPPKFAEIHSSYEITQKILCDCWKYKKNRVCNEIRVHVYGNIKCDSFAQYCHTNAVVPPFAILDNNTGTVIWVNGHLYGGNIFGDLLDYMRNCKTIVNKKGKRDFFWKYGFWSPGKGNRDCFC